MVEDFEDFDATETVEEYYDEEECYYDPSTYDEYQDLPWGGDDFFDYSYLDD